MRRLVVVFLSVLALAGTQSAFADTIRGTNAKGSPWFSELGSGLFTREVAVIGDVPGPKAATLLIADFNPSGISFEPTAAASKVSAEVVNFSFSDPAFANGFVSLRRGGDFAPTIAKSPSGTSFRVGGMRKGEAAKAVMTNLAQAPEPSSLLLMGTGLACAAALAGRRRRA